MYKRITIFILGLVLLSNMLGAGLAVAADGEGPTIMGTLDPIATQAGYSEDTQEMSVFIIVANVLSILFTTLGVIFMLIVLYAGFRWMTAGGNEEKVTEAKKLLINATIGLAIVLLALSITYFVGGALGPAIGEEYNPAQGFF